MFEWLRRSPKVETRRVRLGVALGGGAVRGAAHIGVLAVLEREGIRPDVVTGVSAGAIVGAGIAAGIPPAEMLEAFHHASWLQIALPAWRSRLSMLDASPLGALIEKVTSVSDFESLELPFAAIACDLLTGSRVVISSGPLREAIVASSAVPGIFEPVRREGQMLVDGGLVDNVPVQAALDLGADYVLGVDILPLSTGLPVPKDLREVLLMSWEVVQRQCEHGRARPDLLVVPAVTAMSPWDFSRMDEAYDQGVAAMEAALPRLRSDLARGMSTGAAPRR